MLFTTNISITSIDRFYFLSRKTSIFNVKNAGENKCIYYLQSFLIFFVEQKYPVTMVVVDMLIINRFQTSLRTILAD